MLLITYMNRKCGVGLHWPALCLPETSTDTRSLQYQWLIIYCLRILFDWQFQKFLNVCICVMLLDKIFLFSVLSTIIESMPSLEHLLKHGWKGLFESFSLMYWKSFLIYYRISKWNLPWQTQSFVRKQNIKHKLDFKEIKYHLQ